jgi:hypothetical protein
MSATHKVVVEFARKTASEYPSWLESESFTGETLDKVRSRANSYRDAMRAAHPHNEYRSRIIR